MKRNEFLKSSAAMVAAAVALPSCDSQGEGHELKSGEIQHTVMFNLKSAADSDQTARFLSDGKRILSAIPTVRQFQAYAQVSKKNSFRYYFTMVFSNQADYTTYNEHPDHVAFVEDRWMKEVSDFQEADFVRL